MDFLAVAFDKQNVLYFNPQDNGWTICGHYTGWSCTLGHTLGVVSYYVIWAFISMGLDHVGPKRDWFLS